MITVYWILHNAVRRGSVTEVMLDVQCEPIDERLYLGKYLLTGSAEVETDVRQRVAYALTIDWMPAEQIDAMALAILRMNGVESLDALKISAPESLHCPTIAEAEAALGVDLSQVQSLVNQQIDVYIASQDDDAQPILPQCPTCGRAY